MLSSVVGAYLAIQRGNLAEERRQIAAARQISAQAELLIVQQANLLERSVLLAVESMQRLPSLEADQALRNGLSLLPRSVAQLRHNANVLAVAFSPDGRWLATGSYDGLARVWEVTTGQEVARLVHEDVVWALAFSPDGQWLATGSEDGTARVFLWRSPDLIAEACPRLTRKLTLNECHQYLHNEPYRKTCSSLPDSKR
jgi:ketosteroid isomerase-like protein